MSFKGSSKKKEEGWVGQDFYEHLAGTIRWNYANTC